MRSRLLLPALALLLLPSPAAAHGGVPHGELPPPPSLQEPVSPPVPASEPASSLPLLPFLVAAPVAGVLAMLLSRRLLPSRPRPAGPQDAGRYTGQGEARPAADDDAPDAGEGGAAVADG